MEALTSISRIINEGATASDVIASIASFNSGIQESANATASASALRILIGSIQESVLALDAPNRRLLWETINTSEVTDWVTINNAM